MTGVAALLLTQVPAVHAIGADAALLVEPDGRAQLLQHYLPASGPLDRFSASPGAWYALLYLPMAPQWPVQLLLWPAARRGDRRADPHGAVPHALRLFALDAAPDDAPAVMHALPLDPPPHPPGRAPLRAGRFMLPAASTARGVFVLVEQWRHDGRVPAPPWVRLQAQRGDAYAAPAAPVGSDERRGHAASLPPASPLTQQLRAPRAHEVPILGAPALSEHGGPR